MMTRELLNRRSNFVQQKRELILTQTDVIEKLVFVLDQLIPECGNLAFLVSFCADRVNIETRLFFYEELIEEDCPPTPFPF